MKPNLPNNRHVSAAFFQLKFGQILLIGAGLISLFGCEGDKQVHIKGWEEVRFLDCSEPKHIETTLFRALDNRYSIQLPIGWPVSENSISGSIGVVACDTAASIQSTTCISLMYLESNEPLSDEFVLLLDDLIDNPVIDVLRFGSYSIFDKNGFWILTEDLETKEIVQFHRNVTYFPDLDSVRKVIITISTNGEKDFEERQCSLFSIVNSFQFHSSPSE